MTAPARPGVMQRVQQRALVGPHPGAFWHGAAVEISHELEASGIHEAGVLRAVDFMDQHVEAARGFTRV